MSDNTARKLGGSRPTPVPSAQEQLLGLIQQQNQEILARLERLENLVKARPTQGAYSKEDVVNILAWVRVLNQNPLPEPIQKALQTLSPDQGKNK